MFVLKAINSKYYERLDNSQENLFLALKDVIICNNHLDLIINFSLSFLLLFTSYASNNIFSEQNSINFYFICKIIINLSFCYLVIEILIIFLLNPPTTFKIVNIENNEDENNENINKTTEPTLINYLVPKMIHLTKIISLPHIIFHYWHTFNSIYIKKNR